MQPRRSLMVTSLVIALSSLSVFSLSAHLSAQGTPSPVASPVEPPPPYEAVETGEVVLAAPTCVDCYLGLWRVELDPGDQITIPPFGSTMTGYLQRGTVDLTPSSPTYLGSDAPIPAKDMFLWPANTNVSVTNAGDKSAFIFLSGIVEGRSAIELDPISSMGDPEFTPLGGVAFSDPGQASIAILIGKFELEPTEAFALGQAVWPSIVNITLGDAQRTSGLASLDPELVPVQVNSIDELDNRVRIVEPSTTTIFTALPSETDSIFKIGRAHV